MPPRRIEAGSSVGPERVDFGTLLKQQSNGVHIVAGCMVKRRLPSTVLGIHLIGSGARATAEIAADLVTLKQQAQDRRERSRQVEGIEAKGVGRIEGRSNVQENGDH